MDDSGFNGIRNKIHEIINNDTQIINTSSNPDDIPIMPNDPRVFGNIPEDKTKIDYSKYDNPDDIPIMPNDPRVFSGIKNTNQEKSMSIGDLKKMDYESIKKTKEERLETILSSNTYEIKYGTIDTNIPKNGLKRLFPDYKYTGEYVEFSNMFGLKFQLPLATFKYDDETQKHIFVPFEGDEKNSYIEQISKFHDKITILYDSYSDTFKQTIKKRGVNYSFVHFGYDKSDFHNAIGWASRSNNKISIRSDFIVTRNNIVGSSNYRLFELLDSQSELLLETFTHENGHALANDKFTELFMDMDTNDTFRRIYKTVINNPVNERFIGSYAMTNSRELFAEATKYYFHDPDKLKMVDISETNYYYDVATDTLNTENVNMSLYDYMDNILK